MARDMQKLGVQQWRAKVKDLQQLYQRAKRPTDNLELLSILAPAQQCWMTYWAGTLLLQCEWQLADQCPGKGTPELHTGEEEEKMKTVWRSRNLWRAAEPDSGWEKWKSGRCINTFSFTSLIWSKTSPDYHTFTSENGGWMHMGQALPFEVAGCISGAWIGSNKQNNWERNYLNHP